MKKINTVNEWDLLRFIQCPLRVAGPDSEREAADSAADSAAEDLLKWISWEAQEGDVPSLPVVRTKADAFFRRGYTGTMPDTIARRLIRIARRLHDLVSFNRVLHPTFPYELELGPVRISGSMTILQCKLRPALPTRVIRLQNHKIVTPVIPDVVSLARWLYVQREDCYPKCVVYGYSLSGETTSNQQFTESQAHMWLSSAARNWLDSRLYPSPGAHCKGCLQPCRGLPEMIVPSAPKG